MPVMGFLFEIESECTMKIAFLGSGNMGSALAHAAVAVSDQDLYVTNRTFAKAQALAKAVHGKAVSNCEAAACADMIFLCVKPQMMEGLFTEIRPVLQARTEPFTLVSVAAGLTCDRIREWSGTSAPVIRLMPNTPCAVGEGMMMYAPDAAVTAEMEEAFLFVMKAAGRFMKLPENLIDAGSAVAGCGPAFACLFLEALADGGVACGLPRAQAMEMAEQMLLGTAILALQSGQHPGAMKDSVCSPAGSTIQGVRALEEHGFRAAVMDAVIAAFERNRELGKQ